jgi:hypothetical protein
MTLKIEVEEMCFSSDGSYRAIVRANRYEKKSKSIQTGTKPFQYTEEEKTETPAEFRINVSRVAQRARKTERPIEDIKRDAKAAVLELCREITSRLEPKPKTQN